MTSSRRCSILGGLLAAALNLVFMAAGCSSEPEPGRREGHAGHHGPPPTPMAGQDTFFDGRIVAELNVGASGFPDIAPADGSSVKSGGGGGGHHHGSGGGFGGGGGGGGHRHGGGPPSDASGEGGDRPAGTRPMLGRLGPALMIHLRFTNRGAERVELRIDDFSSPLGNFAVQPEKLVLEPGQSVETEPMSSQLAGELTETDATLVLHLANQVEKKVVILRAVPTATGSATAGSSGDAPLPAGNPAQPPGK